MGNTARRIRQSLLLSSALFSLSLTAWAQSPIDTNAPYYLSSGLGTTVDPTFQGGTLKIDQSNPIYSQDFYVSLIPGSTIDKNGNTATFIGSINGGGRLTTSGAGTLIVAGNANVRMDVPGGTLQIGNGGTEGWINNTISLSNGAVLAFDRSDTVTHSGSIIGHGVLHQDGGTLILAGQYSYDGGTVIAPGSTLQMGNGIAGLPAPGTPPSLGDIVDNGTLLFKLDTSHIDMECNPGCGQTTYIHRPPTAITISANVSGAGSLAQWGAAPIILTGTNTYSGGTAIDLRVPPAFLDVPAQPAVIQIGNGGTAGSITGDVEVDYGKLVFNRSDTYAFAGAISGSGQVEQRGPGTLALTGTNTYTGGTTISAGTLQLGDGGATGSIVGDVVDIGTLVFDRSNTVTFAGNISGSGGVEQKGSGTTILTGTSSYWGGTTISAGTLQLGNGGTTGMIWANGIVINDGTLAFNRSNTVTYNGIISGAGTLLQMGPGTLVLTGASHSRFRGTTVIEQGATLQLGTGDWEGSRLAVPLTGNVVNNGTLVFDLNNGTYRDDNCRFFQADCPPWHVVQPPWIDPATPLEFGGNISGTGSVRQTGQSPLVLSGANTYTGGTTIDYDSILSVGNGGVTGSITGNIIDNGRLNFSRSDASAFDGDVSGHGDLYKLGTGTLVLSGSIAPNIKTYLQVGTLQIGDGGTTGSLANNIFNAGTLIFDRSDSYTFAAVISDNPKAPAAHGAVQQIGTGTLILNGHNTYTGLTTVSAGTLMVGDAAHPDAAIAGDVVVAAGATLSGHGTIGGMVTNNGGTVSPGGSIGTLTVQNLTQSPTSTLHVDVTPAGSSQLIVTGTANLAGALEMDFAPGDYSSVRSANFLSAGSITGAFTSFVRGGAAGTAVFGLVPTPTGFNVVIQSERGGQIYSDLASVSIDRIHDLNRRFNDHDAPCHADCPTVSFWAVAFGGVSSNDDRTYQANDYWSRSAGVIGGADYRLDNGIKLGVGFSHSAQVVGVTQNWGMTRGHSMAVALNGSLPVWDGRLALDLVYASNSDNVHRDLGTFGSAAARRGGHGVGVEAQIAYPLPFEGFSVSGQLSYAHQSFAGSTESGVSAANLAATAHSYDSLRGEIGALFRQVYNLGSGLTLAPQAGLGVLRELNSVDRGVYLSVESVMNSTFVPPYAKPDRMALTGQVGAEIGDDNGFALLLKASGFVSGHQRAAELSLGGRLRF